MVFANYTNESAPRKGSTSLVASIAVHFVILFALFGLRTVTSQAPRVSATQLLYVPVPKPAPRPVKALPRPLIAPRRLAVLPKLPAPQQPQLMLNLPAPPELAPLPEVQPVVIAAAPIPVRATPPPASGFTSVPLAATPPAAPKLPVTTGAFETAQAGSTRSSKAVLSAGFGDAGTVAAVARPQTGAVGAFGDAGAVAASPRPRAGVVGSFGAATTADPASHPAAQRAAVAEPLEILDKPRPAYTESARQARIEGDVLLEVLFAKSGTLRVLRVVRGLGYGLEQNATDAAAKIRFRPAKEDGRSVDMVAMVRISFQMAY